MKSPTIAEIAAKLHQWASPAYAEEYDNPGFITGDPSITCTGILCCLDALPEVVDEAISLGCNLIVAHHPILFKKIRTLSGEHYTLQTIRKAIKADIAILAVHTNLDHVHDGVNSFFAEKIGLTPTSCKVLEPKSALLRQLTTYVPAKHLSEVQEALFAAGAGSIGGYSECGFSHPGTGTFRPGATTNPLIGHAGGPRESVTEEKLEVIFEKQKQAGILQALKNAHPYEEVAYHLINIENNHQLVGSGMIGLLPEALSPEEFLQHLSRSLNLDAVRYSPGGTANIRKVAICGGAGSFLIGRALAAGADAFVTSDLKYHEYFEAKGQMLLADIGHYESEYPVIEGLVNQLKRYFTTFAVLSTRQVTNPTRIFVPQ